MKGGGEALFGGEHIGPAFEELRGQPGRHGAGLTGEGGARREPAGGVVTGDNFDGADGLRPGGFGDVNGVLRAGGAGLDLGEVKVARVTLLLAHVGQFQSFVVIAHGFLGIRSLLRGFDGREIGARHRGGERLPGKFVVGCERVAFGLGGGFFRADASPHVGLPRRAEAEAIDPALR